MKIENIFSNFIATDFLDIDTQPLIDCAYEACNLEHNQSTFLIDKEKEPINSLVRLIDKKLSNLHTEFNFKKSCYQTVSEIWVNINNSTNIDAPHSHPNRVFSAVVYLKAPANCGDLIFMNPNPVVCQNIEPTVVDMYNSYNSVNWKVTPQENMVVFFPSWLFHYVKPNLSGEDRISLAMNSVIVSPH